MMPQKIAVAAAVAAVVLGGLAHRWWTDRQDNAPAVAEAAAKVQRLPLTVGAWRGEPRQLDAADTARAGYAAAVWRRYEEAKTGRVVSLLLVCGVPARVAAHTPDACYPGAGFEMRGDPTRVTLGGPAGRGEFWKVHFAPPPSQANGRPLCIYWALAADAGWVAADNPRQTLAHHPVLYKLYLVCELPAGGAAPQGDPCADLARVLLPQLRELLAAPAGANDEG
jgi:hypothetical protein